MLTSQTVFNFDDPVAFLNAQFRVRQKKDPKFSLRAWARQMGYQNPSLLFQVLKGERRLKMDLALKCAASLNLKGKALRYFELIVLNHSCQSSTEKRMFRAMIARLKPRGQKMVDEVSLEAFQLSSDWYHWAIWAMAELPDFRLEVNWIHARLDEELDKKTIRSAIQRLLKLKLFIKDVNGQLIRTMPEDNPLIADYEVPSEAVRSYHRQMIERAHASVEKQTFEERQLRGSTIAFKKSDLGRVAQIIAEAHRQVMALSASGDADEVYQFNSQFFRLTKKKVERTH